MPKAVYKLTLTAGEEVLRVFKIDATDFYWIDDSIDDPEDFCLHGNATVKIGAEIIEYGVAVSATALYLLKTLTEDHIINTENQLLPCCGFFIVANKDLTNVDIFGCDNGIDWSVIHEGNRIKLITEAGIETYINIDDYKKEVFTFADKVEEFYQNCSPKIMPDDEFTKNGYIAFWNEWHKRRNH